MSLRILQRRCQSLAISSAQFPFPAVKPYHLAQFQPHRRQFFNFPDSGSTSSSSSSAPAIFTTTRSLPYLAEPLYEIITDINSYSKFLPYCLDSKVTKVEWPNYTPPDFPGTPKEKPRPIEAELRIGYMAFNETFTSRVKCEPFKTVTADSSEANLFDRLSTRWEVKPWSATEKPIEDDDNDDLLLVGRRGGDVERKEGEGCNVSLRIEFAFKSAMYQDLVGQFAPRIAGELIKAFADRAEELLGEKGVGGERKGTREGKGESV